MFARHSDTCYFCLSADNLCTAAEPGVLFGSVPHFMCISSNALVGNVGSECCLVTDHISRQNSLNRSLHCTCGCRQFTLSRLRVPVGHLTATSVGISHRNRTHNTNRSTVHAASDHQAPKPFQDKYKVKVTL